MDRTTRVSRLSAILLLPATALAGATAAAASTDFEAYLQRGYSEVAAYAWSQPEDPAVSVHFEQKAEMAGQGLSVAPDRPLAGNRELAAAHRQLLRALSSGAAEDQPRMAAVAQVNYDCWAADLGGAANGADAASCRLLFYTAINQIAAADDGITPFVTNAGPASSSDPRSVDASDRQSLLSGTPTGQDPRTDEPPIPPAASTPATSALFRLPGTATTDDAGQSDAADSGGSADDGSGDTAESGAGTDTGAEAAGRTLGDTVGDVTGALGGAVSDVGRGVGGALGALGDSLGKPN